MEQLKYKSILKYIRQVGNMLEIKTIAFLRPFYKKSRQCEIHAVNNVRENFKQQRFNQYDIIIKFHTACSNQKSVKILIRFKGYSTVLLNSNFRFQESFDGVSVKKIICVFWCNFIRRVFLRFNSIYGCMVFQEDKLRCNNSVIKSP